MTASVQQDALLAKFAVLAYKNEAFLQNPNNLPLGWTLEKFEENGSFVGVAFKNENGQVIIAYRGTDGANDGEVDAAIATGSWHGQFQQGMNFVQTVKALPGFENIPNSNILVTGHSLGGTIAQIVAHAYGFDGSSIDPGGAQRIVGTPEFAAAAQAAGLTPPGAPATFKNWLVAGSTVSGGTGPHIGGNSYVPSLPFSSEQALTTFLLALINPAVGAVYMVGADQFSNKHASEQISQALGMIASGQDGGSLPTGSITLNPKILGYDSESKPVYSQGEFEIKDANGTVISTVKFSGQGADRTMEIYGPDGAIKTTVGSSADGKTITTANDTNHDGNLDQNIVTAATVNGAGQLTMTVERDIAGHRVKIEFVEDEWGDLKASRVVSVDGKTPLNPGSYANALNAQGYSPWDFADGQTPTGGSSVENIYTSYDPMSPVTLNAVNALSAWLNLILAIRNGQPLPIISSGVNLVSVFNPQDVPLAGAGAALGGISSLLALQKTLENRDLFGTVNAGAQIVSYGAQLYAAASGQTLANALKANAFGDATSFIQDVGEIVPYLNIANAVVKGDAKGVILAVVYRINPIAGLILTALDVVFDIFGDDELPSPYGEGKFIANADGSVGISIGINAYGGDEVVNNLLQQFKAKLETLITDAKGTYPTGYGLVADRMLHLTYNNQEGKDPRFFLDVYDPKTGGYTSKYTYDWMGNRTNVPVGSDEYFRDLAQEFIRTAFTQQAIAPAWEVETARQQKLLYQAAWEAWRQLQPYDLNVWGISLDIPANLDHPGLSEVQGAAALGKLATPTDHAFKPILLDLNRDGVIDILAKNNETNQVAFDIDDSGYLRRTAWAGKGEGILVLDRNYNAHADTGSELFSNAQVADELKGVASLRWVDADRNGIIDQNDPVFNHLRVWQDKNSDGLVGQDESFSLASLNIQGNKNYGIALHYDSPNGAYTYDYDGAAYSMSSHSLDVDATGSVIAPVADAQGKAITDSTDANVKGKPVGFYVAYSDGSKQLVVNALLPKANGNKSVTGGLEDLPVVINNSVLGASVINITDAHQGGVASVNDGMTFFAPEKDYNDSKGTAFFTYTTGSGTQEQKVEIDLKPVNDAPVITDIGNTYGNIYGYKYRDNVAVRLVLWKPIFTQGIKGYAQNGVFRQLNQMLKEGVVDPYSGKFKAADVDGNATLDPAWNELRVWRKKAANEYLYFCEMVAA